MSDARTWYEIFYRCLRSWGGDDPANQELFATCAGVDDPIRAEAAESAWATMNDWFTVDSLEGGIEHRLFMRDLGEQICIVPSHSRHWFRHNLLGIQERRS